MLPSFISAVGKRYPNDGRVDLDLPCHSTLPVGGARASTLHVAKSTGDANAHEIADRGAWFVNGRPQQFDEG
jgi:hypothetical protein